MGNRKSFWGEIAEFPELGNRDFDQADRIRILKDRKEQQSQENEREKLVLDEQDEMGR
ncbi:MAG: hypothetical protein ACI4PF_06835 [Christensenellales bacterium]